MDFLTPAQWSPYVAGIGIGILSWFTWLISDEAIGCSTTFARSAGMIERVFRGKTSEPRPYFQKIKPVVDWQFMLVIGIVIGALVSSLISGDLKMEWIPPLWKSHLGDNLWLRLAVGFSGGLFLGFGSRWAGGCTSGHGISGTMQLALSSWISALCFFAGGISTAWLLFRIIL
jgi:uncharacterized membrane protein YedE/YeeE